MSSNKECRTLSLELPRPSIHMYQKCTIRKLMAHQARRQWRASYESRPHLTVKPQIIHVTSQLRIIPAVLLLSNHNLELHIIPIQGMSSLRKYAFRLSTPGTLVISSSSYLPTPSPLGSDYIRNCHIAISSPVMTCSCSIWRILS